MRSATAEALQEAGISISAEELDRRVAEAIRELVTHRPTVDPRTEFTPEEHAVLVEGGFDLSPLRPSDINPELRAAEQYAALLATSLTVREAAQRLGVDGSRIRQRLLARQMFGIRRPTGWLLPMFQFDGNRLVPGIERVLSHLNPHVHPLAVVHWFVRPHPDLCRPGDVDETPMSPRDWLLSGGNPELVAELAEDAAGYA